MNPANSSGGGSGSRGVAIGKPENVSTGIGAAVESSVCLSLEIVGTVTCELHDRTKYE